jgi:glycosyltransferase involved in cell wall biosynthesis
MAAKATILQVVPELNSGGVERGTVELSDFLAQNGYRSLVVSSGGRLVDNLKRGGAEHIELPMHRKNPFKILSNARHLEEIIRSTKIDIIHARSRAAAWAAWLAAKRTKTPFVTTFHGVYGRQNRWKHYYNQVMTYGERVIAVSDYIAAHMRDFYEVPMEKIRTIHRGVDIHQFDPERVSGHHIMKLTESWHVPDDLPIIVMPGRITRWKGQHILLKALAALPHRNFFCLLVGDNSKHPNYQKELEFEIEQSKLTGHVRFTGATDDMVAAYQLADIIVSPSIEPEAFGRVPIEAQVMGKPIIATHHGGATETVIHGETGWLVTPNHPMELKEAIETVLGLSETQKQYMAKNAFAHVSKNFSTEAMCAKVLDVYHELLSNGNEEATPHAKAA